MRMPLHRSRRRHCGSRQDGACRRPHRRPHHRPHRRPHWVLPWSAVPKVAKRWPPANRNRSRNRSLPPSSRQREVRRNRFWRRRQSCAAQMCSMAVFLQTMVQSVDYSSPQVSSPPHEVHAGGWRRWPRGAARGERRLSVLVSVTTLIPDPEQHTPQARHEGSACGEEEPGARHEGADRAWRS